MLVIIPSNTFGGAHNQVLQLAAGLERIGFHSEVLVPREPGGAAERLAEGGVAVRSLRLRRPRARSPWTLLTYAAGFAAQVRTLRTIIGQSDADIVQAHGLLQLDVALAAKSARRPLVWQLLDTRPPRWLAASVGPMMLRLSTAVMTTGTTTAAAYSTLRRSRKPVIPFYPPGQQLSPRDESEAVGPVTFGCLANINPQKGYDVVIRSFVAADLGDVAVLRLRGAITPGHERLHADLLRLVHDTHAPNVDLGATAVQAGDFLPTLDVLVLGSARRSEGTPTVIIEAMSLGLPVIATRVGGVPELVADGVTGFLVEPGDVAQMARRMEQLARDEPMRSAMGSEARKRSARSFTREQTLQSYSRAYSICLGAAAVTR